MTPSLPPVGTNALLEQHSSPVPDDFIATLYPRDFTGGRRHILSLAQLWRVPLLAVLTPTHSLNLLIAQLPEQSGWRRFARLRRMCPTARMLHEFRAQLGVSGLRRINQHLLGRLLRRQGVQPQAVALMDATDLPASCSGFKKNSAAYTAAHATLGGRTLKTGQSRWFVGYKKHTLRLWLPTIPPSVTLLPLVSWVAPANVSEGGLLVPSLHWCRRHWGWWPGIVVADLGYLSAERKQAARTGWVSARLLRQVRPWIEPAQSFEKNQLGLGQMFFNSLRLTWQMSLWAESAVLLRTMAWLDTAPEASWLARLQPCQLAVGFAAGKIAQVENADFFNESALSLNHFRNTL